MYNYFNKAVFYIPETNGIIKNNTFVAISFRNIFFFNIPVKLFVKHINYLERKSLVIVVRFFFFFL